MVDPLQRRDMYCPVEHGAHDTHSPVLLVGVLFRRQRPVRNEFSLHCLVQGAHP